MKKIILSIIIMILVLSMAGCTGSLTATKYKDLALDYLNDKYGDLGDTYTPYNYSSSSWESTEEIVRFTSEKYDNRVFQVFISESDGGYEYIDDYYALVMQDNINEIVESALKDAGMNEQYVAYISNPMATEARTFEELKDDEKKCITETVVFCSLNDYDEDKVISVVEQLGNRELNECVCFYKFNSQEEIDKYIENEKNQEIDFDIVYERCYSARYDDVYKIVNNEKVKVEK